MGFSPSLEDWVFSARTLALKLAARDSLRLDCCFSFHHFNTFVVKIGDLYHLAPSLPAETHRDGEDYRRTWSYGHPGQSKLSVPVHDMGCIAHGTEVTFFRVPPWSTRSSRHLDGKSEASLATPTKMSARLSSQEAWKSFRLIQMTLPLLRLLSKMSMLSLPSQTSGPHSSTRQLKQN